MSLFSLKPVICLIPALTGGNGSNPNAPKVTLVNRQAPPAVKVQIESMKEREQPVLQESSAVSSRREMVHLAAVSLCFASFFMPAAAEARTGNATVKEKITEKVEMLKEKAGSSMGKVGELKDKAGMAKGNIEGKVGELKEKAGMSKGNIEGKVGELKDKAGMSKGKVEGKVEDLKEKAGSSKGKVEELKDKAGMSMGKADELKQKAGLPKPRDEGKVYEP